VGFGLLLCWPNGFERKLPDVWLRKAAEKDLSGCGGYGNSDFAGMRRIFAGLAIADWVLVSESLLMGRKWNGNGQSCGKFHLVCLDERVGDKVRKLVTVVDQATWPMGNSWSDYFTIFLTFWIGIGEEMDGGKDLMDGLGLCFWTRIVLFSLWIFASEIRM
jgi:hypothetical protein